MALTLNYCHSITGSLVAWGNYENCFIGLQAECLPELEVRIRKAFEFVKLYYRHPVPYAYELSKKYIRPTILNHEKGFPLAFKVMMSPRGISSPNVDHENQFYVFAPNWSPCSIILLKETPIPELNTILLPILVKFIESAKNAGVIIEGNAEDNVKWVLKEASEFKG